MTRSELDALSLTYRRAYTDPARGALRWTLAENHSAPSYVAELWYWCAYVRRASLCNVKGGDAMRYADDETRALFSYLTSVQPYLMRARRIEVDLGIRWTRESMIEVIRGGRLRNELRAGYSYSLLHIYLERRAEVETWVDEPVAWYPPNEESART